MTTYTIFDVIQFYTFVMIYYPCTIPLFVGVLAAGLLLTGYVFGRDKRNIVRQQRAYERQETVFHKGEREQNLLRPVVAPDNYADELLRSQAHTPQTDQKQLLRIGGSSQQQ